MKLTVLLFIILSCFSCKPKEESTKEDSRQHSKENLQAKDLLQGVWFDEDANTPVLRVDGDTLLFIDQEDTPLHFQIVKDSLYTYGYDVVSYKVLRQSEYTFWFYSLNDRVLKLYKSENLEDSLYFAESLPQEATPIYTEVVEKDSVVFYNDRRFHGYVYINPSSYKVNKPTYSDEGIRVDNIYFDNVIHICVYEGTESLFSRDIYKKDFEHLVTETFYNQSVLADMDFEDVRADGYHFLARLGIPESYIYNLVRVVVSFDGELSLELKELYIEE